MRRKLVSEPGRMAAPFIHVRTSAIPKILEVSIGHALIADALWMGLFNAVQAYLKVLSEYHPLAAPSKK